MKFTTTLGLSILVFCISIKLDAQTLTSDSLILVNIYNATGGPDWTKNENWLTGPINTWEGITTDGNRVTGVRFSQSGLNDSIPSEIFNLTALKELYLFGTVGIADESIKNLTQMEELYISNWNLKVDPEVFCEFPILTDLSLINCQGFEEIPPCMAQRPYTKLYLIRMGLQGASDVLTSLASIPSLTHLNLDGNIFTEEIPEALCQRDLVVLNLSNNQFTGEIPDCLNQNGTLRQLFLEKNQLTGEIPTTLFKEGIGIFKVSDNQLVGTMDDWVLKPSSLYNISLSNNQMSGDVNGTFFGENITTVEVNNNNFTGIENINENLEIRVLRIDGNKLFFDDLQKLPIPIQTFEYNNQQNVNETEEMTINAGDDLFISMDEVGDDFTEYQWYLNDQTLNDQTTRNLNLHDVNMTDEGSYHCEATHIDFPDLILSRNSVVITVDQSNHNSETSIHELRFYPNPAKNTLHFQTEINGLCELRIFDLLGNLISVDTYHHHIDISHLENGIYTLEVVAKDHQVRLKAKFIVSK